MLKSASTFTIPLFSCVSKTPATESVCRKIAKDFTDKWWFPHCLGAVDGKHIFIQPPANDVGLFYNNKSRFSITIMTGCWCTLHASVCKCLKCQGVCTLTSKSCHGHRPTTCPLWGATAKQWHCNALHVCWWWGPPTELQSDEATSLSESQQESKCFWHFSKSPQIFSIHTNVWSLTR